MLCVLVLLTDLVNSRNLENRQEIDRKLELAIEKVNEEYSFYAPLTRTKGIDEMSGVLDRASELPLVCMALQIQLHGVGIRFSAAEGEIDIRSPGRSANHLDGPAFHAAGNQLMELEARKRNFAFLTDAKRPEDLKIYSDLMEFCLKEVRGWPSKSGRIAAMAWEMKLQPYTQEAVAKRAGVTQQAVSAALERTEYNLILSALTSLSDAIPS